MVGELIRRWLEERPILGELFHQRRLIRRFFRETQEELIVPASGEVLNARIEEFRKRKMEEWARKGVPEPMRRYAMELAERYIEGMARFLYPENAELQKRFMAEHFPRVVEKISEPWIRGLLKAMGME